MAEDGAGATDEGMMHKAMRLKEAKNLDTTGTKHSSSSFIAFLDSRISSSLGSVGISMGRHSDEISVSANVETFGAWSFNGHSHGFHRA
jgi:hypothetical protein